MKQDKPEEDAGCKGTYLPLLDDEEPSEKLKAVWVGVVELV